MAARFKLDENIPRDAVALFEKSGHDVRTVLDEGLGGSADRRLLTACHSESRTLVTFDLDFADIRRYPPKSHAGIWVLRSEHTVDGTVALLQAALTLLETETPQQRLWIVERGRVRIRE